MKRLLTLLSILVVVFFASCETPSEKIARLQPQMIGADGSVNKEVGAELIEAYMACAKENPQEETSPDMVFKALDVSVNIYLDNPQKSVDIVDYMIATYPQHYLAPMALFVKAFVYERVGARSSSNSRGIRVCNLMGGTWIRLNFIVPCIWYGIDTCSPIIIGNHGYYTHYVEHGLDSI